MGGGAGRATSYQLQAGRNQSAPANEVPEVERSGSAKRQEALAELPAFTFHLSAISYKLGGINPHQRSAKRQEVLAQL